MSSILPKTIFITGATSGFGKATAKLFNDNGWQTIITGRRGDRLEQLAEEKTGVEGWVWVKHLPASSTTWFYKDDDLQGVNYGTAYNTTSQWSITYPSDKDEILLVKDGSTFDKWLRIDKSVPTTYQGGWYGGYSGTHMTAIDSSLTDKRYAYFNDGRSGAPWFWIGHVSHNSYSSILYQEDSENVSTWPSASANPENVSYEVFVRSSTDKYSSVNIIGNIANASGIILKSDVNSTIDSKSFIILKSANGNVNDGIKIYNYKDDNLLISTNNNDIYFSLARN